MKREGRQHSFVRTGMIHQSGYNPSPSNKFVNRLDSPPAFGVFTKVPSKPTNHSKSTRKCERAKYSKCHVSPAMKSAVTSKGGQKLKSTDWWVEGKLDQLIGSDSSSASDILDTLCGEDYSGHVYDYDDDC
ncbi:hypothetical protein F2Q69_00010453 [Brassica cretica]|uniref:Uncharacterized protein n=1 Tax=Brassica cretica TaxID=69181 RepID=A0A8S9R5M4_BRACR|nr:hypothetical protein F2Q69_00010453 [Brassica cretica]